MRALHSTGVGELSPILENLVSLIRTRIFDPVPVYNVDML